MASDTQKHKKESRYRRASWPEVKAWLRAFPMWETEADAIKTVSYVVPALLAVGFLVWIFGAR